MKQDLSRLKEETNSQGADHNPANVSQNNGSFIKKSDKYLRNINRSMDPSGSLGQTFSDIEDAQNRIQ